jgi:hypothetical protein
MVMGRSGVVSKTRCWRALGGTPPHPQPCRSAGHALGRPGEAPSGVVITGDPLSVGEQALGLEKSPHLVDLPSCNRAHVPAARLRVPHCPPDARCCARRRLPASVFGPVHNPPWLRQRPFLIACAMHSPPLRVFAPHLRLCHNLPSPFTPRPNP